jgi:7,8-dihydropterin-6-yl-methyl-4-(beta-D-ribofuranosyl)aminobenzene 5'-phosphate synthase
MPISANHALHHLSPLHSEWGLSLLLEPQRGEEKRTFLLDFGWTPEVINIGDRPDMVPWHEKDLPVRSGHGGSWG